MIFHFFRKDVCYFLLVINSNLRRISYRFPDMASCLLKCTFFFPRLFNPEFESVPLALDRKNFACLGL